MARRDRGRQHVAWFFTNWRQPGYPLGRKLGLTVRNRLIAMRHGCCGHHGEPGC